MKLFFGQRVNVLGEAGGKAIVVGGVSVIGGGMLLMARVYFDKDNNYRSRTNLVDVKDIDVGVLEIVSMEEALVHDCEDFRYQALGGRLGIEITFKPERLSFSSSSGSSFSSSSSKASAEAAAYAAQHKKQLEWQTSQDYLESVEQQNAREPGSGTKFWNHLKDVGKTLKGP